jgi:ubiquinone/menaquinone biosynthesis C-methylase UbiE
MENEEKYIDEYPLSYHMKQWDKPKESTKAFCHFINHKIEEDTQILDLAAGTGAPTYYLAKHFKNTTFVASDYSKDCVEIGSEIIKEKGISNLRIQFEDWYDLQETEEYDGVISLQTLSWLEEPEQPIKRVLQKLKPRWFALTSLFYEGDISYAIKLDIHSNGEKMNYNIYSLKHIERIVSSCGYRVSSIEKFNINIDIPKPENLDMMGTYTKFFRDESHRVQLSGALIMPWYMVMIER